MSPSQKCAEIHVSAGRLSSGGPIQGVIDTLGLMRRSVAFALFAVTVGFAGGDVAAAAERVPAGKLTSAADVEVFMQVRASRAEISTVERRIRSSGQVRRYAHLSRQDAKAEFARIFKRNPDLVAAVEPSDLPESFRVDLVHARDAEVFTRRMRRLVGVESAASTADLPTEAEVLTTIRRCQVNDADLEIFMTVGATQAEFEAAAAAVGAIPGLSVKRVLSSEDAYEEFRRIFRSHQDLVDSIRPADLPRSIRVHADPGILTAELMARLQTLPGVEEVGTPQAVCDSIRELLAGGLTPELLAHLMVASGGGLPT